ncbi:MAG: 2-oxoacid:acceptor oxidoreductase family protein [Candidatus Aminicenantes bacterium]|nr:2-oxoacid:acceptor oxidoreductase family protein [Candidatus Aminicenantes bacterium]
MSEIRFSGYGGQGIIRCGLITGKAVSLFDNKFGTMTQSFGPEARGSACSSQLVISDERVLYPYITRPEILVSMSQDAYEKYEPDLRGDGTLIYDTDLVKPKPVRDEIKYFGVPSTRFAEEMGNRIFGNLVMLGFFTAITKLVSPEAMKKALPGLVPKRFLELNIRAFDKGYDYGIELLAKEKEKPPAMIKPDEKPPVSKPKKRAPRKAKS